VAYKLTVRAGPKVRRSRHRDLDDALDALEARGRELARDAPGEAVDLRYKRVEARDRIVARLELAGPQRLVPSVRAGVDVHGDGSIQAYRGRVRRAAIDAAGGDAYVALRRALSQR